MVNDTKIGRYTYPKIKIFIWQDDQATQGKL